MRSLRTTLVAGLTAISFLVVGGFAGLVYARARGLAREETAARLRLHADTLAGLLEIGRDGLEFETGGAGLPEYRRPGSGSYAVFHGPDGRPLYPSPSIGERVLPAPPAWGEGQERIEELEAGPDGVPAARISRSFLVRVDPEDAAADPVARPASSLRYRVQVVQDVRAREAGLASLAWFLGLAGAGVVAATVGLGLLLARLALRPIHAMTAEAAGLDPADASRRLHPSTVVAELHSLAETLNSALDRLGAALERQRRFTSDASHELRTPVSVLLAGTELLLRRPRTAEEYRQGLERQARTIRRMREITENLLALARADAAAVPAPRDPVDLGDALAATADEMRPLAEEKGLDLRREIAGGVVVRGDRDQLSRLAGNLIANAVKFTPAGGSVVVRASAEDGEAALDVEDTGPGIPAEDLPHVFERFYRAREGRDGTEGAGLGLAIADWIARAHGGRIAAANLPGGGAAFRVRLPLDGKPVVPASPAVGEEAVRAVGGVGEETGP